MSGQHLDAGWRLPFAQAYEGSPAPRWIDPTATSPTMIHGFDLSNAMVYLADPDTRGDMLAEPSAVDPALPVSGRDASTRAAYFSRSYRDLTPDQRHDYLAWLADGRRAPEADRSFVRLYLAGLERRVILDFDRDPRVASELPAIANELRGLRAAYADRVYPGFADSLLDVIAVLRLGAEDELPVPAIDPTSWEEPPLLRVGLGRFVAQKRPIPPAWAAVWSWYRRDVPIRTALYRTPDEYAAVFAHRYAEALGDGLTFRTGSRTIAMEYSAANLSIGAVRISLGAIPDVFGRPTAGQRLRILAEQVWADLGPYARAVNRSFLVDDSLSMAALLPPILQTRENPAIAEGLRTIDLLLGNQLATPITHEDLVDLWWPRSWDGSPSARQLATKDRRSLVALLGRFGYGVDPDPRYGKRPGQRNRGDDLTIFRAGSDVTALPSEGWDAAVVTAQFGAAVIAQDEALDATTAAHLAAEVAVTHALPPAEVMRLQVALADLAASDDAVKLTGMKGFIDPLTDTERERACDVVIGIAARAGVVSPSIVTLVQKIARLLGLDPQSVPSRLFGAMTSDGPMLTPAASGPLVLDHATIAATTAATEVVSSLLGGLLAGEDDPASRSAPATPPPASASIPGLDAAHAALLLALAASQEDRWDSARLEALAQEHHLLAAGAIDTLNDAALDLVDEPVLIEEAGGFALDRDVLAAMIPPVGTSPMGTGRPD